MKLVSGVTEPMPEPVDRLTRLCAAMTEAMEAHAEYRDGDRVVILLTGVDDEHGGMVAAGYDDNATMVADLLAHTQAVAMAVGLGMDVLTMPDDVSGITDDDGTVDDVER